MKIARQLRDSALSLECRASGNPRICMHARWSMASFLVATGLMGSFAVAQTVRTEAGALSGVREGGLDVYKGVPFAAQPIGQARWKPPAAVAPWEGVRKADAFAPACMQEGVSMPGEAAPPVSEDCLYLNI